MISKLIISCRTHFFHTSFGENILNYHNKYYVQSWNINQISSYLKKRIPIRDLKIFNFIENTYNLFELAKTPLFLEMIVESLDEDFFSTKIQINSAILYHYYTEKWFNVASVRKGSIMTEKHKKELVEDIAWRMISTGQYFITLQNLRLIVLEKFNITKKELIETFLNDITNCSFFKRNNNLFEFSHTSFMEYFVASKIVNEIINDDYHSFEVPLRAEIYIFCAEILKNNNISIDYEKVLTIKNPYYQGNIMSIASALQDKNSIHFFEKLVEQDLHPGVENLIVTSVTAYPFEYSFKILTKLFFKTNNSIVKLAIQNYLKYSDMPKMLYESASPILNLNITPTYNDSTIILADDKEIVRGYVHALRLHRLRLKNDKRWIITVNISWLFAACDYREIIPILEYYSNNSKVNPVIEVSKECLKYFYANQNSDKTT